MLAHWSYVFLALTHRYLLLHIHCYIHRYDYSLGLWLIPRVHKLITMLPGYHSYRYTSTSTIYWQFLTLNMLNCFRVKDVFTFHNISWILLNRGRPNSQQSNPTYCLSYIVNTMPADALATKGARAPAGMVLTKWTRIVHLQHQKS